MATEKQIQANRENAKKSTGPRTDEGKHRVSRNGLKHGLLSTVCVIPGESPADYDKHLSKFQEQYWPSNPFEHALVRQMADAEWRLQRISRLQAAYLTSAVANRRDHHNEYRAEKALPDQEQLVGTVMQTSAADIDRFARYEVQLQRVFTNAFKQLMAFRDRLENDRELRNAQTELDRDPSEPNPYRRVSEIISPYYRDDPDYDKAPPDQPEAPPQVQSQSLATPKKPTTSDPPPAATSDENAA